MLKAIKNLSLERIMLVMKETFVRHYSREPTTWKPTDRIYAELRANEPFGRLYALEWLYETVRQLNGDERKIDKPHESEDYTLLKIAEQIQKTLP